MASGRKILVEILGDESGYSKSIDKATKKTGGFTNILKGAGMGIGLGMFGLVTSAIGGVTDALGESVGINYVGAGDKGRLITRLAECADSDYFERGIELMIEKDRTRVVPFDIRDLFAVEVDFEEDLSRANQHL